MIDRLAQAAGRSVSRGTYEKIEAYVAFVRAENTRQNLISASSVEHIWARHIVDSAQLARFEPWAGASWLDIGSGAGLPGIVLACIVEGPVTMIEPRPLRAEFLHKVTESLGLRAVVLQAKAERAEGSYEVITARAVAPLPRLFELSHHLSTGKTVWALPQGRSASTELAEAQRTWQGVFHVERSVTDADSYIVVATGVRAKQS